MLGIALFIIAYWTLQAAAHGGVTGLLIGGEYYKGFTPYQDPAPQSTIERSWATVDPIEDPMDPTSACNDDGSSLALQLTAAPIAAGSAITAYWSHPWPHSTGPVLAYLAKCPGSTCTGVNASTLQWFKIDEAGLLSGNVESGQWAAAKMIAQNSSWTTTIPSCVPSGYYLIRFETIALQDLPAQMYPECAQIQITGSGSQAPTAAELVNFPGAYHSTDPGMAINIYGPDAQSISTYTIPGPPLYGCGATGSASGNSPSNTTLSTATTTPATPEATTPAVNPAATPATTPTSSPASIPMSTPCSTPLSTPPSTPVSTPLSAPATTPDDGFPPASIVSTPAPSASTSVSTPLSAPVTTPDDGFPPASIVSTTGSSLASASMSTPLATPPMAPAFQPASVESTPSSTPPCTPAVAPLSTPAMNPEFPPASIVSAPASTTASTPVSTPASTPVSNIGAVGAIGQYGQCGGMGYAGPTTCISPFTCIYDSPYYSQCQ